MIIGNNLQTLLRSCGFEEFLDKLEDLSFQETNIDLVEISLNNEARISFITKDKLERYISDSGYNVSAEKYLDEVCDFSSSFFATQSSRIKYGTKTKFGRFMRKFFTEKEFTTAHIEKMTALAVRGLYEFEVVEGEDITQCYNGDSYASPNGTLGGSCMRYDECESYFVVYEDNAKMLILKAMDCSDRVLYGRAILWDNVELVGQNRTIKVMDRIYTSSTELEEIFKSWAEENNYHHKCSQNYSSTKVMLDKNNEIIELNGVARVNVGKLYSKYPYMDTFDHLSPDHKYLYVGLAEVHKEAGITPQNGRVVNFRDTEGNQLTTCDHCGATIKSERAYRNSIDADDYDYDDYDEYYDGDFICKGCWDEKYVYIRKVGTVIREEYEGKIGICMLSNDTYLLKDMIKYAGIDLETKEIKYGLIAKEYESYGKYNEKLGCYADVSLSPCDVCGEYHIHNEVTLVAKYNEEKTKETNETTFDIIPICKDCFNKQLSEGKLIKTSNGVYCQIYGKYDTSPLHNYYIVKESLILKCKDCGEEFNVLDSFNLTTSRHINKKQMMCLSCIKKEDKRLSEIAERKSKIESDVWAFRAENPEHWICDFYTSAVADIALKLNSTIDEISQLSRAQFRAFYIGEVSISDGINSVLSDRYDAPAPQPVEFPDLGELVFWGGNN